MPAQHAKIWNSGVCGVFPLTTALPSAAMNRKSHRGAGTFRRSQLEIRGQPATYALPPTETLEVPFLLCLSFLPLSSNSPLPFGIW